MSFLWTVTPEAAWVPMTDAYIAQIRRDVRALAQRYAVEITAYMKANHVWQNRTGEAEAGLYSLVEDTAMDMVRILLSHGSLVPHGLMLEIANGGRFAVIAPTIDLFAPRIFAEIRAMLRS